jgi:tetratricopeptide (TPR) repeat protein
MTGYTTREVAQVLDVPPERVRSFARDGLLEAERGSGRRYRFTFHDIILLRTAQELSTQGVSYRRIRQALRRLREQLPAGRPLSAVRIVAVGDELLVQDRETLWSPVSGQVAFDFAVEELAARVEPFARRAVREREAAGALEADDWYDLGFDLEAVSLEEAKRAYRRALDHRPEHAEALVNLGRLVHEEGDVAEAERHYRRALEVAPGHALARYNLGVALEDQGAAGAAADAYREALERDPELAGAHFNLARLCETGGDMREAVQHLAAYKRLRERARRGG